MTNRIILYDLSFLGDDRVSGVERFSVEIYQRLSNTENRRIYVLLPKDYKEKATNDNVSHIVLPFKNKILNHTFMFYVLFFTKIDKAFFPAFPPFPLFYALCAYKKVALIRVIHDVVYWKRKSTLSFKSKLYLKPLETWLLKRYTKVVTVSQYSSKKITDTHGINNIFICPNGVSLIFNSIKTKKDHKPIKLISVGTIEPRKNFLFLIDVLEKLTLLNINAELTILGRKGWGHKPLMNKINTSPCAKKVHIKCGLTDRQLNKEYNASSIFVFPSLEEGFGIPIIEAMRTGLPVVASHNSAITEIVSNHGILIDNYDASTWAKEIINLINSPTHYTKMTELSLERAQHFSWDNSAQKLMGLMDEK